MYANILPTVVCTSNDLICGYITTWNLLLPVEKEVLHNVTHEICHNLVEILQILSCDLYANSLTIVNAAGNF